jgi:hypothetical protein
MLDTCYAMLEFIVTVTVWLVVLMFNALVEFVVTLGWQEVHDSELYLVLQMPCFRALRSVTTAMLQSFTEC